MIQFRDDSSRDQCDVLSEKLIEHPVVVIEALLKLGMGDKGRLLYLRNAIKKGTIIHNADKKFLKRMKIELDEVKSPNSNESNNNFQSNDVRSMKHNLSKNNYKNTKQEEKNDLRNKFPSGTEPGILKNQHLLGEIKKSNSKLMDNLELLWLSRENLSHSTNEKPKSFSSLPNFTQNNNFDWLTFLKNNFKSGDKLFDFKKHDIMTYTSAGLFALWFAGYQNLIDIGPLQTISLGLSAGAAVSAGLLYKQHKTSKKENT